MPKFEVSMTRTVVHTTTILVDAEDEDEAMQVAISTAEEGKDELERPIEWELDEENYDVESIDEDEPEAAA